MIGGKITKAAKFNHPPGKELRQQMVEYFIDPRTDNWPTDY